MQMNLVTMKKLVSLIFYVFLGGIALFISIMPSSYAASITATIDWNNQTGRKATQLNYGLNAYQFTDPNTAGNPGNSNYKANVAFMKVGILRLHNTERMNDSHSSRLGWVISPNTESYKWDVAKITKALDGAYNNNSVKMLNIANWPSYMDDGTGKLKPSMYDAYARFCAELVRIINIELGHKIPYWEVTNEKDDAYREDMSSLAAIFNKAYDAMKAVDSSIKVGGPAFANAYDYSGIEVFLEKTKDKVDFVSYHTYSLSNDKTTKTELWNSAAGIGYPDSFVSDAIKKIAPNRASVISAFHDEFNMERNNTTQKWLNDTTSLIYDALAIRSMINAGSMGSMAWNEGDNWWGKLNNDSNWTKRPASYLYKMLNEHVLGNVVSSSSSNNSLVEIFAIKSNESPKKAFVLINRSQREQTVQLSFSNWKTQPLNSTPVSIYQIGPNGYTTGSITHCALMSSQGYSLPPDTVTVFEYYLS
ncbi:MAG TPA: hypothetical protein DCE56_03680 [Cyanobacteria bacterium UBA8553]|nr:hypothetical protein [Cyanobacteria bacterium UBA8553]